MAVNERSFRLVRFKLDSKTADNEQQKLFPDVAKVVQLCLDAFISANREACKIILELVFMLRLVRALET